ncbi:MAG: diaminopimelate decarboxylase [bacterium]|nr:diaminopimelate decarboxylase [bacterium]
MDTPAFMTQDQVRRIQAEFGTPVYVYDEATLEAQARTALAMPNAYGLSVRYAMKALPSAGVIRLFNALGIHIDASSGFEAERAMKAGIPAGNIQVTAQELPKDLKGLLDKGILFNACSINQLREYGHLFPGTQLSVRMNPGRGVGHNNRTNVGGPASSFGIWRDHVDEVLAVAKEHDLTVTRMHTHIGSGGDPDVWEKCAKMSLAFVASLPDVTSLCLGGGFKVARVEGEKSADLMAIGERLKTDFEAFAAEHGRELNMEIEPGTFLVANGGALVATAIDVVDTGSDGYRFIKTDSGMTEVLRPSLYGAQHPIVVVPATDDARGEADYIVVGHCCESGDILTPKLEDPEGLEPRRLTETRAGDAVVVGGSGAYCAAMASKNYNSFPEAPEVLLRKDGTPQLIRRRQTLDQMLANEVLD